MRITPVKSSVYLKYACLFGCLSQVHPLYALEFKTGFYLPTSINYDSNLQMVENGEESVSFYNIAPRLSLVGADEVNTINLDGSILFQRSSDDRISESRRDPTVGLGWTRDFTKGQFTLSTNYNKTSTRVSELRRTGVVFTDGSAVNRSINAGLSYLLTEKLNLTTGLGYQEVNYSGAGLTDFSSKTANAKLNYLYSQQLSPFVQFSINKYENDTNTVNTIVGSDSSVSRNVLVGYTYQINPQTDYSIAAGVNRVSSAGSGWIGVASARYAINEKSNVSGAIARSIVASGLGGFQKSDSLNLNYTYDVNQSNHVGAEFSWNINRALNDTRFKQINGFYTHDISNSWGVRTYAQYRMLDGNNTSADGYQVGVSLNYNNPNFF
jgi:hypothetical protein